MATVLLEAVAGVVSRCFPGCYSQGEGGKGSVGFPYFFLGSTLALIMGHQNGLEREVRDIIRRNRWLTLSTASMRGAPQSSVVVYASDGYIIYVLTGKSTVKVRNILENPRVSVTIPFYKSFLHRMISVAPPAAVTFRGKAETLEYGTGEAAELYGRVLKFDPPEDMGEEGLWIRVTPGGSATCHGVGVGLFELRDPVKAHKIIELTNP